MDKNGICSIIAYTLETKIHKYFFAMKLDWLLKNGKKKELLFQERQAVLDNNLNKTVKIQEANTDVQKSIMEIAWKNQELNENLTKLVLDNERTKNLLLERENKIKAKQEELEERQKEVRREEI